MFDFDLQFDYENCSDAELKVWLKQTVPIIELFIFAAKKFYNSDTAIVPLPCKTCPKIGKCNTPCNRLNALLADEFAGSSNLNNTVGDLIEEIAADVDQPRQLDHSFLRAIDRVRSDEIFMLYKNCLFLFTKKEWRVITLKVQQGMTYGEIAEVLASSTSNVSDIFQRAKKKMENHYTKKRGLNK